MSDRAEGIILSLIPAPPACPLRVLSVVEVDGWISGWAEPVVMMALVERRFYTRNVAELPGDPLERRTYVETTERNIEPVIYDANATTGLSTWSDLQAMCSHNEDLSVIRDDIAWDEIIERAAYLSRRQRRAVASVR